MFVVRISRQLKERECSRVVLLCVAFLTCVLCHNRATRSILPFTFVHMPKPLITVLCHAVVRNEWK
jgi:hypothetical protein